MTKAGKQPRKKTNAAKKCKGVLEMGRLSKDKREVIDYLIANLEAFTDEILDREEFKNETGLEPALIDEALEWILKRVNA